MTPLAWRILAIFVDHIQKRGDDSRDWHYGYIASWTLGIWLGGTANTIDTIALKYNPRNEYEVALRELLDLGIVEEMEELHCRYRLVVKEKVSEQPKPQKPGLAEYWTKGAK